MPLCHCATASLRHSVLRFLFVVFFVVSELLFIFAASLYTAAAMKGMDIRQETASMPPYWGQLKDLSNSEKRQLIVMLEASMLPADDSDERRGQRESDERWVKELQALHYEGEPTAEEKKRFLRESRHFSGRDIKYSFEHEE